MAKGAEAKQIVTKKILETFPEAFLYNDGKEIRVPIMEQGVEVQIKIALTCAKENVTMGADIATPGDFPPPANTPVTPVRTEPVAPTAQEKQTVADLLKALNL